MEPVKNQVRKANRPAISPSISPSVLSPARPPFLMTSARHAQRERAFRLAQLTKQAVSHAWAVPEDELRAATRRRAPVATARQIAMYLCHVVFGLSFAEIGRQFYRDRTTVAYACECIEDRRDDAEFDLMLDRIELAVRAVSALAERPVPQSRRPRAACMPAFAGTVQKGGSHHA
jgi:hypothetical protein